MTRARDRLTVVGTAEALEQAIARPLSRASGLRRRLWPVVTEPTCTAASRSDTPITGLVAIRGAGA